MYERAALVFTYESDLDNQFTICLEKDYYEPVWRPVVSISDERAVGSYNDTVECQYRLSDTEAMELRDWLTRYLETRMTREKTE